MVDQSEQLFFEEGLEEEEESSFDVKRYLNALVKRKWLILTVTMVITLPWMIYVKQQAPIYEAETIIRFKDYVESNESLVRSRITELSSRRFAEKVVQQLGLCLEIKKVPKLDKKLNQHQVFQEFATNDIPKDGDYSLHFHDNGKFYIKYYPKDIKGGVTIDSNYVTDCIYSPHSINGFTFRFVQNVDSLPPEIPFTIHRFRTAVDDLLARKQVSFGGGGALLILRLAGDDPVLVAKTVNSLAEIYRRESIHIKDSDTGQKLHLLQQKLALAEESLGKSRAELKEFEQSHFISLDSEVGTQTQEREALISQRDMLELQKERLTTMLNRLEEEIQVSGWTYNNKLKLVFMSLVDMNTFENNSEMHLLKNRLTGLEAQRNAKLTIVTEAHQGVKEITAQILAVYAQIHEAAKSHLKALALQIRQKQRRISSIGHKLNMLPQERQRQSQLLREVENNQKIYDELKAEVLNAEMSKSVETENIEIFQKAYVPEYPVNGNKKKRALVGALVSLMLGICTALLLEFLDKSIKTPDDIKKHLKINILGTIPEITFKGTDEFKDEEKIKQIDNQLVTHDYSPTPIGEAYRSLRTNLVFSKRNGTIRKLVITSTAPGDGKSFTSSNIAISMAQQRTNTLLVDADLRRGVLHNTFGINKEPGFTNFLTNSHTFTQVVNETYIPNLSVVSCGSLLPNPSELLGSLQMKRFLEQAQRKFEIIIFDSPPLNAATDAVVIGTQVDGVVLVVRAGITNREIAKAKLEMFKNVPAKILGAVLNGGDTHLAHEAYSYYHY